MLGMEAARIGRLRDDLEREVSADLLFDDVSRAIFATDASLYQMQPLGVVLPRTRADLVRTVRVAARHGVPILPRGAGTSLAGQTVTAGVAVDCSKYLTRVLEVNERQRWARVEPGIVLDNLNDFLRFYGLFFAPDVATSSRATLGGMVGNNSAGVRSVRYGKTVDHVLELRVVLSSGEELLLKSNSAGRLGQLCARTDREGLLHREVRDLIRTHRDDIRQRFPRVMRRVGGYNLDYLLDEEDFNLARLVVGSEGTLACVTEIKVALEPIPASRMVAVLHFDQLLKAISAVQHLLEHGPSAVEIIDAHGIRLARENPVAAQLCSQFVQGDPEALLIVEFSGDQLEQVQQAFGSAGSDPRVRQLCYAIHEAWERAAQEVVWQVRKNALGVLLSLRGDAKPLPFVEDACVPVRHLPAYIEQMLELCRRLDRPVAMYAHASVGVIHVRPILDLKQEEDVRIMEEISEESFQLVRRYGGAWSGEHGDGLVRSHKNREFFGDRLYEAFRRVKAAFDPPGLMNPGKIVDSPSMSSHLRIHPGYRATVPPTHFRFAVDGGFDRAVEMCTGVGQCRKTLGGTMCPSFMATRDEEHSTRGRANALRAAMAGDLGPEGFTSPRLYEVLDLCLECKACKSECPSNVDMARLKAEFLAHYHRRHGLPLGKRLIADTRQHARSASRLAWLANAAAGSFPVRWLLEKAAGVDRRRRLPRLASPTLTRWFAKRKAPAVAAGSTPVALLADTFTEYFQPQVGQAAIGVLEALGFEVTLLGGGCCGRPLISTGQLERAERESEALLERLEALEPDVPVVVLEPSCLATLADDLCDLGRLADRWKPLAARLASLEGLLASPAHFPRLAERLGPGPARLLLHGHCQQKALFGTAATRKVLGALADCSLQELDAGCCGMAGSFGYEKEHYALSEKIGARRLFPAVKNLDYGDAVVAPGFSCRAQIHHFTGRRALHPAEVLAAALES